MRLPGETYTVECEHSGASAEQELTIDDPEKKEAAEALKAHSLPRKKKNGTARGQDGAGST